MCSTMSRSIKKSGRWLSCVNSCVNEHVVLMPICHARSWHPTVVACQHPMHLQRIKHHFPRLICHVRPCTVLHTSLQPDAVASAAVQQHVVSAQTAQPTSAIELVQQAQSSGTNSTSSVRSRRRSPRSTAGLASSSSFAADGGNSSNNSSRSRARKPNAQKITAESSSVGAYDAAATAAATDSDDDAAAAAAAVAVRVERVNNVHTGPMLDCENNTDIGSGGASAAWHDVSSSNNGSKVAGSGGSSGSSSRVASSSSSRVASSGTEHFRRRNSVLRVIRIMQLRKQKAANSSASNTDVQVPPGAAASEPQQQQQGLAGSPLSHQSGAVLANTPRLYSSSTGGSSSSSVLPADEVLVTDTSHLNPVYRRIRLQELRLKLQQQLRGPQLQQQVLQVQQQQQGNLGLIYQSDLAGSSSSRDGDDSISSGTRGPTRGLNSVQRAIRIAQLHRILQHRHTAAAAVQTSEQRYCPSSSSSSSSSSKALPHSRTQYAPTNGSSSSSSMMNGIVQQHFSTEQQQQQQQSARTTVEAEQQLVAQLVDAGVPAAVASALLIAADNTPAASPTSKCRTQVVQRLQQLQGLLQLQSLHAAAKTMIKQPNLLARKPVTLRQNVDNLGTALQLPQQRLRKLLHSYPTALDMAPESVIARVQNLAKTLEITETAAVALICKCPRVLGLAPDHVAQKISDLRDMLDLRSRAAAVDLVQGFPALLGLNSNTLACKWQRLRQLSSGKPQWQSQVEQLQQQRTKSSASLLGRLLAAGPNVIDRLQYALDAEAAGNGSNSSISAMVADQASSSSTVDDLSTGVARFRSGGRPTKAAGDQLLSTLLLHSEREFVSRYPDFVLWRLKQRSTVKRE